MSLAGLAILCVAIPVLRDLLVRERHGSGAVVAAIGYGALLCASFAMMRGAGMSTSELGIGPPSIRSLLLGSIAGILVVAPVWRIPAVTDSRVGWLLIAVMVEEVVFRGVLYALLRRAGGFPLAIAGSTVAFTLAHSVSAGWPSLVLVALAGLFLGLLRAMRGDLWACGVAHLLMDLVSLT